MSCTPPHLHTLSPQESPDYYPDVSCPMFRLSGGMPLYVPAVACVHACSICMRSPERLPLCETEAGWSVHRTCVEAAGRGLSRLPRPRLARGRGPNPKP
eukprot:359416-Chlamydomonas_euryale.AAC.22